MKIYIRYVELKSAFSLCLNKYHAMKTCPIFKKQHDMKILVPHFLKPSARWKWVVSFTPRPLYHTGNEPPESIG